MRKVRMAIIAGMWIGGANAWAEEPPAVATETVVQEAPDRVRLRDLLDDTISMTGPEREIYLRAILGAHREPQRVEQGLERAVATNARGATYDDVLGAALGPDTPPEPSASDLALPGPDSRPHPRGEGMTAETLKSIREYKARHLEVRNEMHFSGGGTSIVPWGFGMVVSQDPISSSRTWAVYQGPLRLEVPRYLEVTHQEDLRKEVVAKVTRKQWLSRGFYGLAAGGVAAIVAGYVGNLNADSAEEAYQWSAVGTVGLGATVVGLVGGSIPAASARRLRGDFPKTLDIVDTQHRVDVENEQLRQDLGLTPEQALDVEQQGDREERSFRGR